MATSWWHEWVREWAADINRAMAAMTSTFETTYGFAPGVNEVRFADDETRIASRRYAGDSLAVREMAVSSGTLPARTFSSGCVR